MAEIFISFIHEEEEVAKAVQRFLQAFVADREGVFLSSDQWAIYAGEEWLPRIISELRKAKVVISLLSLKSVRRPWVNFEAGAAWVRKEEGTGLIPACFGGLTKGKMPKPYSGLNALDLDNESDQHYLVRSVFHYLGRSGLTPLPPIPFDDEQVYDENSVIGKELKPYHDLREALSRFNRDRLRRKNSSR